MKWEVDQMGIDKVRIDKVGIDEVGTMTAHLILPMGKTLVSRKEISQ